MLPYLALLEINFIINLALWGFYIKAIAFNQQPLDLKLDFKMFGIYWSKFNSNT